jgi:hypothetical protein
MSEFNFAENEQINAFTRELGIILRRIANQDKSVVIEELPTPIESSLEIHFLALNTNLAEVERE